MKFKVRNDLTNYVIRSRTMLSSC